MKRIAWLSLADNNPRACVALHAGSLALFALGTIAIVPFAKASTQPKLGGTLRVEVSARIATIDPRQWPATLAQAAAVERVDSLVFDRLTRLDERGNPQPALAISWQHDTESKRWQFRIRDDVKFGDGASLTPAIAAMALQQLLGNSFDVSANADSVIIRADHPVPSLPLQLSTGRFFIFHIGEDNSLFGTGPFRVTEWPAAGSSAKAVFVANETCWAGRPFVDKIELIEGVELQQQADAISFGQADVVELAPSQVRHVLQGGARALSSDPIELLALQLDASSAALQDERVRRAVSLSIDRVSIAGVILQKQGVAAGGLLPNWISGYAHLFPPAFDLARAKEFIAASGREFSPAKPLVLNYDSSDAEARAVADRVAVNLREAGIIVRVTEQSTNGRAKPAVADLRLTRYRVSSPDSVAALSELLTSLDDPTAEMQTLDEVCAAERAVIDAYRVIPLVHVSESYGLSPQVRDWMAPRWGGWDLANVWLGPPATAGSGAPGSNAP